MGEKKLKKFQKKGIYFSFVIVYTLVRKLIKPFEREVNKMKNYSTWFVSSDILEYGTYTRSYDMAEQIKARLIDAGGIDAKIQYDPWEM